MYAVCACVCTKICYLQKSKTKTASTMPSMLPLVPPPSRRYHIYTCDAHSNRCVCLKITNIPFDRTIRNNKWINNILSWVKWTHKIKREKKKKNSSNNTNGELGTIASVCCYISQSLAHSLRHYTCVFLFVRPNNIRMVKLKWTMRYALFYYRILFACIYVRERDCVRVCVCAKSANEKILS